MIWILGPIAIAVPFAIIVAFIVLEWRTKTKMRRLDVPSTPNDLVNHPPEPGRKGQPRAERREHPVSAIRYLPG